MAESRLVWIDLEMTGLDPDENTIGHRVPRLGFYQASASNAWQRATPQTPKTDMRDGAIP